MTAADPIVTGLELGALATHYPRTVGRNARLGSHGSGGESRIAVLRTDDSRAGWGLVEGGLVEGGARPVDSVVGRALSELVDDDGVRDPAHFPLPRDGELGEHRVAEHGVLRRDRHSAGPGQVPVRKPR